MDISEIGAIDAGFLRRIRIYRFYDSYETKNLLIIENMYHILRTENFDAEKIECHTMGKTRLFNQKSSKKS